MISQVKCNQFENGVCHFVMQKRVIISHTQYMNLMIHSLTRNVNEDKSLFGLVFLLCEYWLFCRYILNCCNFSIPKPLCYYTAKTSVMSLTCLPTWTDSETIRCVTSINCLEIILAPNALNNSFSKKNPFQGNIY